MFKKLFIFSLISLCLFSCSNDEDLTGEALEKACKKKLIGKWKYVESYYIRSDRKEVHEGEFTLTFTSTTVKEECKTSTRETSHTATYELQDIKQKDDAIEFTIIDRTDISYDICYWEIKDKILIKHIGGYNPSASKYKKVK